MANSSRKTAPKRATTAKKRTGSKTTATRSARATK